MNTRCFPYGYGMEKGRIIVIREEATQIHRIFEMRLDGVGVYAIGKKLFEEKVPFFDETRDKSIKKVSAVLYKPIYTGVKGYPAIISKETFDKVQEMKAAPFRQPRTVETKIEEPEEYEMKKTNDLEEMERNIIEMINEHTSDGSQVREMIIEFIKEKYCNITKEENKHESSIKCDNDTGKI